MEFCDLYSNLLNNISKYFYVNRNDLKSIKRGSATRDPNFTQRSPGKKNFRFFIVLNERSY